MAIYNYLQPLTQVADLPEYQKPTWFRKKTGENTAFGDVFNTVVPALTTIGGTLLGGPIGTAVGQAAGQAIVGAVNQSESTHARLSGSPYAQAQIDSDLTPDLARAGLVSSLAGLVKAQIGVGQTGDAPTAQVVNPTDDPAGLGETALDVSGITGFKQAKNQLVSQFNQPPAPSKRLQLGLNPLDPSALTGLIQNAVIGTGSRPRVARPGMSSSFQVFAEGGKSSTSL